jgi:DNA-binding protein HU-beta
LNKSELIAAVAGSTGLSKADTERVVGAALETIQSTLRSGEKVTLPGFGTFSVTERKARVGRNPQTGASIKIAASKAPKFTAGAGLKATVNSKGKAKPAAKAAKPSKAAKPAKAAK